MAAVNILFEDFIKKSDWEKCYKNVISKEKTRVIVLYNDIENLILHGEYIKW